MYSFKRDYISEGQIVSENLDSSVVTVTDSFLMFALEKYLNREIANRELITEIIKVMLPITEEDAKNEWQNGLTFNDEKYYAWFATTGGMKKENNGKCETIFIREDCRSFADALEEIISLSKFKEIEESNEEVCINKDILSRLSLATSSAYMAGDMPDFIVLPQPIFRIVKDYKTVEKFTKQVEEKTLIDYKLVDVHFDDKVDMFDGGAIATHKRWIPMKNKYIEQIISGIAKTAVMIIKEQGFENSKDRIEKMYKLCEEIVDVWELDETKTRIFISAVFHQLLYDDKYIIGLE